MHLLVVEDDARLSRLLKRLLTQDRHVVETALTAEDGLEIATVRHRARRVILDVGLPDRSGFDVARTAAPEGLSGADPDADGARLGQRPGRGPRCRRRRLPGQAVRLRGAAGPAAGAGRRPPSRKSVALQGRPDRARRNHPAGHRRRQAGRSQPARVLDPRMPAAPAGPGPSRDQLLDYAWPYGVALTPNTVEAYIHLLREKVGNDAAAHIETVRGVGYRLREG